jgi:hypothetical protein
MTTRMSFTIRSDADRNSVADLVRTLKDGMRVEIKHVRRSDPQNAKMWAMLGEVADQVKWHGLTLSEDDWKLIFLNGLKRELRIVPNLDGTGFVALGQSSSDLSVAEMADLITLIEMFGANHGVKFRDSSDTPQAGDRTDTPAANDPRSAAAGVTDSNWFDFYLDRLTRPEDAALSLLSRHEGAIRDGLGPLVQDDENRLAVMRRGWRLVRDRNEGKISAKEYDLQIAKLKTIATGAQHAA